MSAAAFTYCSSPEAMAGAANAAFDGNASAIFDSMSVFCTSVLVMRFASACWTSGSSESGVTVET